MKEVNPLSWFEPRDRLPTPEERRALEVKHGADAAFCVRVVQPGRKTITVDSVHAQAMYGPGLKDATSILCWAEVNGRPVGWPEVKP